MPRPMKQGLDYFPLDVDCDDTIKMIEAKYGLIAFAIIIRLWQIIYDNSYFIKWTERELLLYKNRINVDINLINDVINESIKWGLFDKCLYDKYSILTSRGVQRRYAEAIKRRKEITIEIAYWLIDIPEETDALRVKYSSYEVNVDINPSECIQKYTKESKVKEIESNITPYADIISLWNRTVKSLPTVARMTDPRKRVVKARYDDGGIEQMERVFKKVEASDWLCGRTEKVWSGCGFDWVMKESNWTKIVEGNYDNKKQNGFQTELFGKGGMKID